MTIRTLWMGRVAAIASDLSIEPAITRPARKAPNAADRPTKLVTLAAAKQKARLAIATRSTRPAMASLKGRRSLPGRVPR